MNINLTLADSTAVGNSSARRNVKEVSKTNPCLHCGKPDWCYTLGELSVCKRGVDPARGWTKTSKCDREGTPYYAPVSQKQVRAKSKREYFYPDRNGQRFVRVTRIDDGAGKKKFYQSHWDGLEWVNSLTDEVKARIPIYRYAEVRKAIESGEIIFVVEGEAVADYLWERGLAATTFIGGALKYRSYGKSYKEDLAGATLVLCPDRDEPGLSHMEDVAQDFPDTKWLFAPRSDFYWSHLPKSGGLDVADWMQQDKATVTDIMNNITDKPTALCGSDSGNEPPVSQMSLRDRILEIISRGLSGSGEKAALLELAKGTNTQPKEVDELARLLKGEVEIDSFRDERQAEIEELLAIGSYSLNLADFIPEELAKPLMMWCEWLKIRPEVALTAVLTAVSSLHEVGTELVIHRGQDFQVPPILFSALVAESGQRKSPVYRTLMRKPLGVLQKEAKSIYEKQMEQYERDLAAWEDDRENNPKPVKPVLPVYYFMDSTGEGIKTQAQECPTKSLLALIDELPGLLNSNNKYRSGRGSDKQDILSYFDGSGQTVLRATGIKVDVERIYLSIFGGIQPEILKQHTKDLKDADGHWARFIFVNQPLAAATLSDDTSNIDITQLLTGCYKRIALLGKREYHLSKAAFKRYQQVYNHLEQLRVSHPQPGMRAVYAKMEGIIGRLALNLHAVWMAITGGNDTEISLETMNRAIALAEFYVSEVKAIHAERAADNGELSAVLAKILTKAQTKGQISARDARRCFDKMSADRVLGHFRELEKMGYGKVEKVKNSWIFSTGSAGSEGGSAVTASDLNSTTIDIKGFQDMDICSGSAGSDFLETQKSTDLKLSSTPTLNNCKLIDTEIVETENNVSFTATTATTANESETLIEAVISTGSESGSTSTASTATLKPLDFSLKKGDRIECYPTMKHAENKWVVRATVIEVESEQGWFLGCTVQYNDKKKGSVRDRIAGGCSDWILKKSC